MAAHLNRAEHSRRMVNTYQRQFDRLSWSFHGRRQPLQDCLLERRQGFEAGVFACREIDIGVPNLVECVDSGADHARQLLDILKFAQTCRSESRFYRVLQYIRVDWFNKPARQSGGDSVHSQDLNSVRVRASCLDARIMAGKLSVNDYGPAQCGQSFRRYPLPPLREFLR